MPLTPELNSTISPAWTLDMPYTRAIPSPIEITVPNSLMSFCEWLDFQFARFYQLRNVLDLLLQDRNCVADAGLAREAVGAPELEAGGQRAQRFHAVEGAWGGQLGRDAHLRPFAMCLGAATARDIILPTKFFIISYNSDPLPLKSIFKIISRDLAGSTWGGREGS